MTLVELIVAMAIIAVVAIMCASAFATVLGSEVRETNTRLASEMAEERIATGAVPTTAMAASISIGGFEIPSSADTYSEVVGEGDTIAGEDGRIDISGKRSYTVLTGAEPPPDPIFLGDFNGDEDVFDALDEKGAAIDTTFVGGTPREPYTVHTSGRYLLEVWGAAGGDASAHGDRFGGKGSYAAGVISLSAGTDLYLYAGGKGVTEIGNTSVQIDMVANPPEETKTPGGFNGGGWAAISGADNTSATGGGATDIRVGGDSPYHRVVVAGGGGGAVSYKDSYGGPGGYGGGSSGQNGYFGGLSSGNFGGQGGTQMSGGGGCYQSSGYPTRTVATGKGGAGKFGVGGAIGAGSFLSGGGGGWYGGGAGYAQGNNIQTGGGSGWVYTEAAFNTWNTARGLNDDTTDDGAWPLSSSHYLTDIDGSSAISDTGATTLCRINGGTQMPDPLDKDFDPSHPTAHSSTMTGNSRGGFIRVTYLGSS
jgi:type II secretory pathway pseudopilin PulG